MHFSNTILGFATGLMLLGLPASSSELKTAMDVAYGKDPAQRFDVYYASKSGGNAPVILMVHGGGWMVGIKSASRVIGNKIEHWIPKGFVFISANYRMSRAPNPLDQADDVAAALAYAQKHAKDWGADPNRFVLMGHSAGAHLVALVTADPSIAKNRGAAPWLGTVSLDSAALDVVARMQEPHQRLFDQVFGKDMNFWKQTSPQFRLHSAPKPMLLVCSSLRRNSCDQASAFAAKAKSMGGSVTVLPVALGHSQINEQLGLNNAYTQAVDSFIDGLVKQQEAR